MMKIFLSLAAALCCAGLGLLSSSRLTALFHSLQKWEETLRHMESAVSHLHLSIPDLLTETGASFPCLLQAGEKLKKHPALSPSRLFDEKDQNLTDEQWQILLKGLGGLWQESREMQLLFLREAIEKISFEKEKARQRQEKYGRLFVSLGFLSGAALFILLC